MTRRLYLRSEATLESTARQLFEMLAIPKFEERDSVNYPGGSYFLGTLGDLKIRLWLTDPEDKVFQDCRCTLELDIHDKSPLSFPDVFTAMVARLLDAGCYVTREVGATADAVECVVYHLREDGELLPAAESRPR